MEAFARRRVDDWCNIRLGRSLFDALPIHWTRLRVWRLSASFPNDKGLEASFVTALTRV
jgi:hypothetical protein